MSATILSFPAPGETAGEELAVSDEDLCWECGGEVSELEHARSQASVQGVVCAGCLPWVLTVLHRSPEA